MTGRWLALPLGPPRTLAIGPGPLRPAPPDGARPGLLVRQRRARGWTIRARYGPRKVSLGPAADSRTVMVSPGIRLGARPVTAIVTLSPVVTVTAALMSPRPPRSTA